MIQKFKATIKKNIEETPTVHTIVMKLDKDIEFKPGQYLMIDIPKGDIIIKKPYSICSSPSQKDEVDFCIKHVHNGYVSAFMCDAKEGTTLNAIGPIGIFILKEPIENDLIFLATGSGIGPFRCILQHIFEKGIGKNIWLFFGVRTQDEIIYRKEFEEMALKHKNFKFVPVLSREEWEGETGHVQDVLTKYIKDIKGKDAYICGVLKMVEEVNEFLLKYGFKKENIHFEKYV